MSTTPTKKIGRPAIFTKEEVKNRKNAKARERYHILKNDPEWLERKKERQKQSYLKRRTECPRRFKELRRRTYLKHREERMEWQRQYYAKHREEITAKQRKRWAENREEMNERKRRYRIRKRPMKRLDALKKATDKLQQETQRKVDELMRMFEQWEG